MTHGFAYVQAFGTGAQVVDVHDPSQPKLIGAVTVLDGVSGYRIALRSDHLLIPGGNHFGVFALQCDGSPIHAPEPAFSEPFSVAPNPFRSSTTITMSSRREGVVKLDIYDVSGRRVHTLINGTLAADQHEVSWTGHGDDGVTVAPGAFVRLQSNGASQTKKVVLSR